MRPGGGQWVPRSDPAALGGGRLLPECQQDPFWGPPGGAPGAGTPCSFLPGCGGGGGGRGLRVALQTVLCPLSPLHHCRRLCGSCPHFSPSSRHPQAPRPPTVVSSLWLEPLSLGLGIQTGCSDLGWGRGGAGAQATPTPTSPALGSASGEEGGLTLGLPRLWTFQGVPEGWAGGGMRSLGSG